MKKKHSMLVKVIFAVSFLLPFSIAIVNLYYGTIPFWYDPARDLLMALANHDKISLIGQTSGIPGIFYGPYWIWFLSLALFVSHDPRVVAFFVVTLPYFILFPFILFRFKKQFDGTIALTLWLLFIASFSAYATQLWNPHLAPLFCLGTMYLLVAQDYKQKKIKGFLKILAAGFTAGLLMNTHISFGLAVVIGSMVFLLFFRMRRITVPFFIIGLLIAYLPFFAFEIRHGFNQVKTLIETVTSSSAVVRETSVDKLQIINLFFNSLARLLQIPTMLMYGLSGVTIAYFVFLYKKKKLLYSHDEKKLFILIASVTISTLAIYLSTKNPVWDYHFIGVEIVFLLLLGLVAKKSVLIKYALIGWVVVLMAFSVINLVTSLKNDPLKISSLTTKEHIVQTIYNDAAGKKFAVYSYSPATFTPDFDYLLQWKGEGKNQADLTSDGKAELVYLIIPWTTKDLKADFIDNRTPNEKYKTLKTWHIADETNIIKRVRYEKD